CSKTSLPTPKESSRKTESPPRRPPRARPAPGGRDGRSRGGARAVSRRAKPVRGSRSRESRLSRRSPPNASVVGLEKQASRKKGGARTEQDEIFRRPALRNGRAQDSPTWKKCDGRAEKRFVARGISWLGTHCHGRARRDDRGGLPKKKIDGAVRPRIASIEWRFGGAEPGGRRRETRNRQRGEEGGRRETCCSGDPRRWRGHRFRRSSDRARRRRAARFSRSRSSASSLGVSRNLGTQTRRGSVMRFAKPGSPIVPFPMCSCRSTREPRGFLESLT